MSITVTCEFGDPLQAQQAAQRLRRRGYMVSGPSGLKTHASLLMSYPYGTAGTFGNTLMGGLPPMAGPAVVQKPLLSVLTDDSQLSGLKPLLEALGGRVLS